MNKSHLTRLLLVAVLVVAMCGVAYGLTASARLYSATNKTNETLYTYCNSSGTSDVSFWGNLTLNGNWVYNFTTQTPWDSNKSILLPNNFSVIALDTAAYGVSFCGNGRYMFILGSSNDIIAQYNLSSPYNTSTGINSRNFSIVSYEQNARGLTIANSDKNLYFVGVSSDKIWQFNFSTACDLSTLTYQANYSVSGLDDNSVGLTISVPGNRLYLAGDTNNRIFELSFSSQFDVNSLSSVSSLLVTTQDSTPRGLAVDSSGTKLYLIGSATKKIIQYSLPSAYAAISSASVYSYRDLAAISGAIFSGLYFKPDGTKMFITEYEKGVFSFNLKTTYSPGTEINIYNVTSPINGGNWSLSCVADDETNTSAASTYLDIFPFYAPVINSSRIDPTIAYTNNTLKGYCNATDADDANISYLFKWYKNGTFFLNGSTNYTAQGIEFDSDTITNTSFINHFDNFTFECRATDGLNTSAALNSSTLTILNSVPEIASARITPISPYKNDILLGYCNATDLDLDTLSYTWKWYLNGSLNSTGTSAYLPQAIEYNLANQSNLTHFQNWTFECHATDSFNTSTALNSTNITILNSLPVVNTSRITPSSPYKNNTLLGYCNATDLDLDTLSYTWKWYLNGSLNSTGTSGYLPQAIEYNLANVSTGLLKQTQNWTFECKATDSYNASSALNSTNITILNNLPVIISSTLTPSVALENDTLKGYCNATDLDLDTLSYTWKWYLNGSLNSTGTSGYLTQGIEYNVANKSSLNLIHFQNWTFECKATDSFNTSSALNSTNTTVINTPPIIASSRISPLNPESFTNLLGYCNATDYTDLDTLSYTWKWYLNGSLNSTGTTAYIPQGIERNLANQSGLIQYQNWTLECSATDGWNATALLNSSVVMVDSYINLTFYAFNAWNSSKILNFNATLTNASNQIANFSTTTGMISLIITNRSYAILQYAPEYPMGNFIEALTAQPINRTINTTFWQSEIIVEARETISKNLIPNVTMQINSSGTTNTSLLSAGYLTYRINANPFTALANITNTIYLTNYSGLSSTAVLNTTSTYTLNFTRFYNIQLLREETQALFDLTEDNETNSSVRLSIVCANTQQDYYLLYNQFILSDVLCDWRYWIISVTYSSETYYRTVMPNSSQQYHNISLLDLKNDTAIQYIITLNDISNKYSNAIVKAFVNVFGTYKEVISQYVDVQSRATLWLDQNVKYKIYVVDNDLVSNYLGDVVAETAQTAVVTLPSIPIYGTTPSNTNYARFYSGNKTIGLAKMLFNDKSAEGYTNVTWIVYKINDTTNGTNPMRTLVYNETKLNGHNSTFTVPFVLDHHSTYMSELYITRAGSPDIIHLVDVLWYADAELDFDGFENHALDIKFWVASISTILILLVFSVLSKELGMFITLVFASLWTILGWFEPINGTIFSYGVIGQLVQVTRMEAIIAIWALITGILFWANHWRRKP